MSEMLKSLENKRVLVTGAGSGIGYAVASRFLDAGAIVGCNVLPGDKTAEEAVRGLAERGPAHLVPADVTNESQVQEEVGSLTDRIGPIDILVSNAGIGEKAPFWELTAADWDRMMSVHLGGAVNTTRACLPGMREQGFGRILYTASELAAVGLELLTHYCAAKGALVSLSRALAREVGEFGITVNCVAPGPTATPMTEGAPEEFDEESRMRVPMRCFGEAENVAWTWLFLASDAGRWYTGQVISPNGGIVM